MAKKRKKQTSRQTYNRYYEYGNTEYGGYKRVVGKEDTAPDLPFTNAEKNDFISRMIPIFKIQAVTRNQTDMQKFVGDKLIEYGGFVYEDAAGNIYGQKGKADTYPCIAAHLDTVHDIIPEDAYKVARYKEKIYAIDTRDCSRTGVGGDDKCGIWTALEVFKSLDNCKVAFFTDEESGCTGSREADMEFFNDVAFVLQTDRRGYGDFINRISGTTLYSESFSKAIAHSLEKYNQTECSGGLTDVKQLRENGVGICVANCSSGYYKPHQDGEWVDTNEMINIYLLFLDIIETTHINGFRWELNDEESNSVEYVKFDSQGIQTPMNTWSVNGVYYKRQNGLKFKWIANGGFWMMVREDDEETISNSNSIILDGEVAIDECPTCQVQGTYDDTYGDYYCFFCNDYFDNTKDDK